MFPGKGLLGAIDLFSKDPGTLEGDDLPGGEHDGFAGLRVPAAALVLLLDAEFAEAADEHVVPVFQALLDDFEKRLDDVSGFGLGENILGEQILHDMGLR